MFFWGDVITFAGPQSLSKEFQLAPIKPVFIFSLPRAGSTLLQKILMSHERIASISEPWILLPFLYSRKKDGVKTEYGHKTAYTGIGNLVESLPNGEADFFRALRYSLLEIYSEICSSDETYFLDKTPRYYLIIPLIKKLFPVAKFIFLFRNPVSILASFIEAFNNNTLKRMDHFARDLYEGPRLIADGYRKLEQESILVKYEDLVTRPENTVTEIFDYLGLRLDADKLSYLLRSFSSQELVFGLGDHLGAREYKTIRDNRDKWKKIINNRCRADMAKNYILKVDNSYMDIGKYSKDSVISEISVLPNTHLGLTEYVQRFETFVIQQVKNLAKWESYG